MADKKKAVSMASEIKLFNVSELCKRVNKARAKKKKKEHVNLYVRTTNFMRGAAFAMTPEMLDDIQAEFDIQVARFKDYLVEAKKQLASQDQQA